MRIAVASGKGGTGKTTVAASLAWVWDAPVVAADLDVEEPNLHLFLRPRITGRRTATLEVPEADESLCTACGACAELCQFKAISLLGEVLLTFPEMCHGCGGCLAVCPAGALSAGRRELGEVIWGAAGEIGFVMGRLRVGEAMSPPLMRAVHRRLEEMLARRPADVIVDAPPGVSCPALAAVAGADLILMITEPTPFGLYDLRLAHQAFSSLGVPLAVVVNRAGLGERGVYEFCREEGLPILAEIPYHRRLAETYCQGRPVAAAGGEVQGWFQELARRARELAAGEQEEAAHA